MSVSVKICGLNSREAAEAALAAGADFGGLVFFPASPRHVGLDQARHLAAMLRGRVRIVTLMVDPTDAAVQEVIAAVAPDLIQLHGNETPARVAAIGNLARPIIKALAVAEPPTSPGRTPIKRWRTISSSTPRLSRPPPGPAALARPSTGNCSRASV